MKIKSTVLFFSSLLFGITFLVPLNFFAGLKAEKAVPEKGTVQKKIDQKEAKMQMPEGMSEEEMKMFSEFIDSLDQETIDALTAIGEEIIKEADELGIDPFEYIELQAQMQKEFEDKEKPEEKEKPAKEKTKAEKPAAPVTANAQTAQEVFNGIVKVIPIIIQKASSDLALANELLPFKYNLDDLVAYFTVLADDKMLKYIGEPEFAPLIENAKKLYKELVVLNDQLHVPEFSLEGDDAYEILNVSRSASQKAIVDAYDAISKITDPDLLELQLIREGKTDKQIKEEVDKAKHRFQNITNAYLNLRSKEESKYILERILDAVAQAVHTNKIIEESKKVIQKHEPEAIKLKQEQEKKEAEARKKQDEFIKKRPIITRSFNMPLPLGKYKKSAGGPKSYKGEGGYTPSGGKKKPTKETNLLQKSEAKKMGGAKEKKKEEKDKDKKKKKKEGAKEKGEKGKNEAGKEGGKKELSKDVLIAVGGLQKDFKDISKTIKDNPIIKDGPNPPNPQQAIVEGQGISYFLTAPFVDINQNAIPDPFAVVGPLNQAQRDAQRDKAKPLTDLMIDLTRKFNDIAKTTKKTVDKTLKDKKDEQKQFKDEAAKLFKKFEESDAYKSISLLLPNPANPQLPQLGLKADTPQVYQGTPPVPTNIVPSRRDFLLNFSAPVPAGEIAEPPYIQLLREAYEKARDSVVPKEQGGRPGPRQNNPPAGQ